MVRILLTGFNGFIGKNILNILLEEYNSIISICCIEKEYMNNIHWKISLNRMVIDCDVIIHIGAISDTMLKDSDKMFKYNFEFSKVLFDFAENYDKKVIYASSAAIFGDDGKLPTNIYSWSKYAAESYGLAKVKNFISFRYFNVYGPGEEHKGKMASVAYQAYKKGKFKLFPGNIKRDFVYIDDVVRATLYPLTNKIPPGIYEVGSGESRSFEDVLNNLEIPYTYKSKKDIPKGYQYYTKSDSKNWMPDWKPKYNLEMGIKKYKKYLKE